ncbi:unnamed protein product [Paramecium octaurelia]|uniref:Uncharacterized protein n=1 Tax=Paramecium octaurelia TaxID=43137 RepID=A0A8S1WAJ8_PAROT|nr:unnamed protein product [Paramecium octaurelia]
MAIRFINCQFIKEAQQVQKRTKNYQMEKSQELSSDIYKINNQFLCQIIKQIKQEIIFNLQFNEVFYSLIRDISLQIPV